MSTLAEAHAIAALISQTSKTNYLFNVKKSNCEFSVVKFTVDERISHPYEIDIILATQDEVVLEDLLDQECLLTIDNGITKRYFHGIVKECTCIGDDGDYSIFHIMAVPSVWLLSLEQDCRIFQNKNVQDIICEILKDSSIEGDRVRLALEDTERKREFCAQYRETDLNFVSRLLEEEGIFYFFEHHEDKHVIVFADTQTAYLTMQGESQIGFNTGGGNVPDKESVSAFIYSRRLYPGKTTQRDYNYNRINLDLTTDKLSKKYSEREVYDYPGNYFKQKKGASLAQIRQERFQVLGETAEGKSNCPRITPGYLWELSNNDFEGKYLTVAVTHHGSQPQVLKEQAGGGGFHYSNEFLVIPSGVIVRPQIDAVKPIITGVQTAVVTGPKGEEIHTDELGRVTVQFHWDRLGKKDAKSSCWIRVAQSWGGMGRGAQYIPRIGDEVLVEFAEGDPDRPIITGSVYNGDNLPINSLKKSVTQSGFRTKTHKGEGFNELRFDDATGAEEVYIHGEKDFKVAIKNNETKTVGNMLVNQVGKTATITAGEQLQLICGSASIVLDKSGKIVIHGTEVFVSGNTLHLDGKPIQLNMGGAAGITAALIPAEAAAGAIGGGIGVGIGDANGNQKLQKREKATKWQKEHKQDIEGALAKQKELLEAKKKQIETWDDKDKANFKEWFGNNDEKSRRVMLDRINKELDLNKATKITDFKPASPSEEGVFAYVNPDDKNHIINLDKAFNSAATSGSDSKAGVLAHEMSHFKSVGGTKDYVYGMEDAKILAKDHPEKALMNADNFEYYIEH